MVSVQVNERKRDDALFQNLLAQGHEGRIADFLARRLSKAVSPAQLARPSLADIPDPSAIPDMERAVERMVRAIVDRERIIFAVDHDMDGQASAAVLWAAFVDYFDVEPGLISVVTSHRLTEGYGITDAVADRIIASDASLIISADKGSSDEKRIQRIAASGKDVVVTDHHEVPLEGPPESAYACVNPARKDSSYDPFVCGAGVAFLTAAKVRSALLAQGHRSKIKSLLGLTDYVAVATVADCVALRPDRSIVNRALIRSGLQLINQESRPCWQAFRANLKQEGPISSQTIAFSLAPAVASAGRLDWAETGFRFLVARSLSEANTQWAVLASENEERKRIERDIRSIAMASAEKQSGRASLVLIEQGHSGVHGITASRLVERFGKPAAVFSCKGSGARTSDGDVQEGNADIITGSFRSVDGLNIRDALQRVHERNPGMLISFGGHAGAAGATLDRAAFERFESEFNEAVRVLTKARVFAPEVWTDGSLPDADLNIDSADSFAELDPWGKDFPQPTFKGRFQVQQCRSMGDGSHWRLVLLSGTQIVEAVWFSATVPGGDAPVQEGDEIDSAYQLSINTYRGRRKLQLQIVWAQAIDLA
tara:strand:+ start:6384 stop:8174 length:1791 start_codon:yes stop_codon:yes gene_type:complete